MGRLIRGWEDNIKLGLKEMVWRAWIGLIWLKTGTNGGLF